MSQIKHTPGTWKFNDSPLPHRKQIDITADGKQIALVLQRAGGKVYSENSDPEAHANARLIAAAPFMLQTIQKIYERLYGTFGENGPTLTELKEAIDKATKA